MLSGDAAIVTPKPHASMFLCFTLKAIEYCGHAELVLIAVIIS
jgi:hypothetical protein